MNRRDFLKITAVFATAAAVPALAPTAEAAPQVAEQRGLRYSTAVKNSMLDALVARAAFLAIYDTADEMIGIAPLGPISPAAGGAVSLLSIRIEARRTCVIGAVKILDAEEKEMFPVEVSWPIGPTVLVGESVSIVGITYAT